VAKHTPTAETKYDIIVVGNGIIGLSIGLECARSGMRVVVIGEAGHPLAATTASGAMLGCFAEVTASVLATTFGRAKLEAAIRARGLWPGWLAALADLTGADDLVVAKDTVVLLNSISAPSIDDVGYAAIRQALEEYGQKDEKPEEIDPSAIDGIDADPIARPLQAMRLPGEAAIDSGRLLLALELGLQRAGGAVMEGEVTSLALEHEQVYAVNLDNGTNIAGDQVVLAGGVRTQALLDGIPELARRIPRLVCGYGVSCVVRPPSGPVPSVVLRTPNRSFACGLHLVPRGNDSVYIGATNTINFTPRADPCVHDTHFLLDCAVHQLDKKLHAASIVRLQSGNRPVSIDGFPLIGATSIKGLWLASGTYRDGLHMSPLIASNIARCLQGKRPDPAFQQFVPEREPIQAFNRERIVTETGAHLIASGVERNWAVPVEWPNLIEDMFVERCMTFTYALSSAYTPPPEILLALLRASPTVRDEYRNYYRQVHAMWRGSRS
jgi:glycine oxidase